jgi:hypothetical protein
MEALSLETCMTAAFEIREIGDGDLAEVVALLCEGFPRRTPEYWRTGLQKLANRERPQTRRNMVMF